MIADLAGLITADVRACVVPRCWVSVGTPSVREGCLAVGAYVAQADLACCSAVFHVVLADAPAGATELRHGTGCRCDVRAAYGRSLPCLLVVAHRIVGAQQLREELPDMQVFGCDTVSLCAHVLSVSSRRAYNAVVVTEWQLCEVGYQGESVAGVSPVRVDMSASEPVAGVRGGIGACVGRWCGRTGEQWVLIVGTELGGQGQ